MRRAVADLLDEAAAAPVTGWDFRWGHEPGRIITVSPVPWDYAALAAGALRTAATALDMGTGGGEFLDGLPALADRMVATECLAAERAPGGQAPGTAARSRPPDGRRGR